MEERGWQLVSKLQEEGETRCRQARHRFRDGRLTASPAEGCCWVLCCFPQRCGRKIQRLGVKGLQQCQTHHVCKEESACKREQSWAQATDVNQAPGKESMAPAVGRPGRPHEIRGHDGVCAQGRHACAAVSKVTVVGSGAGKSRARERNQAACWESKGQTEATGGRVEGRQTERLQYKAQVQDAHPLQLLNSKLSQESKHNKSRTPDQAKPQDGKGRSRTGKTDYNPPGTPYNLESTTEREVKKREL